MANDGGIGTYLQALVPRIARLRSDCQFSILGNVAAMRDLGWGDLPNARLCTTSAPIFSVREQLLLPFGEARRADLYWAPFYNVPRLLPVPFVATIHDVLHLAHPEFMRSMVRRVYSSGLLASTLRRAKRIMFDSDFSRREAERVLDRPVSNSSVIHAAADAAWSDPGLRKEPRPLAGPYLLYVGNIKRHKNVPFLLKAFHRVLASIPHTLVLIGRTAGLQADPDVPAALAKLGDRARQLGEVPAAEVRRWVAHADGMVTASLYEGFGLPALEAMAAGRPCLVSTAGSLPEICGDAALYADPRDEESFARALLKLTTDESLRRDLVERGLRRVQLFSWDRAAEATAGVLDSALPPT